MVEQVEDAAHIVVRNSPRVLNLRKEAPPNIGIVQQFRMNCLNCDFFGKHSVLGQVDFAHATRAEHVLNHETLGQQLTRTETGTLHAN